MTLRAIKPWTKKTPRLGSARWLEHHLDVLTSKIVRHNETICFNDGCNETEGLECGHLLERRHRATRWDIHEDGNNHAQCHRHNIEHEGISTRYQDSFIQRFGERAFDDLVTRSRSMEKITPIELEAKYLEYKSIWESIKKAA